MMPDGSRAAPQVQDGDRVLFSSFAGTPVIIDEEELLVMSEREILAVLE